MRFAALCVAGAVGFVVVVIGGALLTLVIVAPPSEVGAGATFVLLVPLLPIAVMHRLFVVLIFSLAFCSAVVLIPLTLCTLLLRVELA